nr:hypothetical protein [Tanacetum cinerariifolium]
NERSSDIGVCGSLLPFVSSVSGPCKPLLSGGYRSPQSNYSVGGKVVVLDFVNSSGPMVLDFKNCVTLSVGDATELRQTDSHKSTTSTGFYVSGSYSVRDQCRDYFRQCSSRGISGTRKCTPILLPTDKNGRGANMLFVTKKQNRTMSSSVGSGHHEAADGVNHGGVTGSYIDIGDCEWVCEYCSATFWYGEWVKATPTFKAPLS